MSEWSDDYRRGYIHGKSKGIKKGLKMRKDYVRVVRCKDCRWGKEVCGNIECNADSNLPSEYHGYEWFCPNGERKDDEQC